MRFESVISEHPDDNLLASFQEGSLSRQEHEGVLVHLETCAFCRDVVLFSLQSASIGDTKRQELAQPLSLRYGLMVATFGFAATCVIAAALMWISHSHRNPSSEAKHSTPTHPSQSSHEKEATAPNPAMMSSSPEVGACVSHTIRFDFVRPSRHSPATIEPIGGQAFNTCQSREPRYCA